MKVGLVDQRILKVMNHCSNPGAYHLEDMTCRDDHAGIACCALNLTEAQAMPDRYIGIGSLPRCSGKAHALRLEAFMPEDDVRHMNGVRVHRHGGCLAV